MQNKYEGRTYEEALQKCLRTLELDETELYIDTILVYGRLFKR